MLVYLGALMVLFAYMWMYNSFLSSHFNLFGFCAGLLVLSSESNTLGSASLSSYLFATALVLFLVGLLFWAMVVVVHILDLSLGGFSA